MGDENIYYMYIDFYKKKIELREKFYRVTLAFTKYFSFRLDYIVVNIRVKFQAKRFEHNKIFNTRKQLVSNQEYTLGRYERKRRMKVMERFLFFFYNRTRSLPKTKTRLAILRLLTTRVRQRQRGNWIFPRIIIESYQSQVASESASRTYYYRHIVGMHVPILIMDTFAPT